MPTPTNLPIASPARTTKSARAALKWRRRKADPTLHRLIADMVAARARAGLTQEQVALRLCTTKSAISRLESGVHNRPTLTTIENYALVVGCRVEIKLRWLR